MSAVEWSPLFACWQVAAEQALADDGRKKRRVEICDAEPEPAGMLLADEGFDVQHLMLADVDLQLGRQGARQRPPLSSQHQAGAEQQDRMQVDVLPAPAFRRHLLPRSSSFSLGCLSAPAPERSCPWPPASPAWSSSAPRAL